MSLKNINASKDIEYNLRSPKKYKKTWLIISLVTTLIILINLIPIIYLNVSHSNYDDIVLSLNYNFTDAAKILNYIVFGLIFSPYLYLCASWIVGIDNITKSTKFHIYIWVVYSLCTILALIAIVLCFRGLII